MAKYTLELSINNKPETRIIEADGVAIQDENKAFIAFYKIIPENPPDKQRETLISYNLVYIVSMVRDDIPRPIQ